MSDFEQSVRTDSNKDDSERIMEIDDPSMNDVARTPGRLGERVRKFLNGMREPRALPKQESARNRTRQLALLIGGIVVGIVGMFQPFVQVFYTLGFVVLLISLLCFIAWSHIIPRAEQQRE